MTSNGAMVTLWPNGEPEIWIQGLDGKGYRIEASEGPAGLSLRISSFVGCPGISVSGNAHGIKVMLCHAANRQNVNRVASPLTSNLTNQ